MNNISFLVSRKILRTTIVTIWVLTLLHIKIKPHCENRHITKALGTTHTTHLVEALAMFSHELIETFYFEQSCREILSSNIGQPTIV